MDGYKVIKPLVSNYNYDKTYKVKNKKTDRTILFTVSKIQ